MCAHHPAASVLAAIVFVLATTSSAHAGSETDRRDAKRLVAEGESAMQRGNSSEARAKLTKAIQTDPDFLPAYDAAIPLWLEAGELGELAKYLEVATTRHRDYAFAWYTLGYVYRVQGRPELSVIAYETYLQLRPKDPDPRFGLALALIDQENSERAQVELKRYLRAERRPEREAYIDRARELVAELGGVVPAGERSPTSELARARALIDGLRFASALALIDSIEPSSDNEKGEAWLLRARAHLGAGRPEAAIAAGFVALGHRKSDPAALGALADAFDELGSGAVGSYLRSLAEPAE